MSTPYIYQIGYTHCISVFYAGMVIKKVYYRWGYEYNWCWGMIFKKYDKNMIWNEIKLNVKIVVSIYQVTRKNFKVMIWIEYMNIWV